MKRRHLSYLICLSVLVLCLLAGFRAYMLIHKESDEELIEELAQTGSVPYENLFRLYADSIGWDWSLLAALCYQESHFNPLAQSQQGASGLMQLMPKTASRFGLNDSTIWLPEDNIRAGIGFIRYLQRTFSFITSEQENTYFVLASYNAGPAHIMDARRLAKRYGRSPYVWFDNTEYWLMMLQSETYANDSVVLYGQFANPYETVSYVRKVLRTASELSASEQ